MKWKYCYFICTISDKASNVSLVELNGVSRRCVLYCVLPLHFRRVKLKQLIPKCTVVFIFSSLNLKTLLKPRGHFWTIDAFTFLPFLLSVTVYHCGVNSCRNCQLTCFHFLCLVQTMEDLCASSTQDRNLEYRHYQDIKKALAKRCRNQLAVHISKSHRQEKATSSDLIKNAKQGKW